MPSTSRSYVVPLISTEIERLVLGSVTGSPLRSFGRSEHRARRADLDERATVVGRRVHVGWRIDRLAEARDGGARRPRASARRRAAGPRPASPARAPPRRSRARCARRRARRTRRRSRCTSRGAPSVTPSSASPAPGPASGTVMRVRSSPSPTAVQYTPRKNSSAGTVRSPLAPRIVNVAPSAVRSGGKWFVGSATTDVAADRAAVLHLDVGDRACGLAPGPGVRQRSRASGSARCR